MNTASRWAALAALLVTSSASVPAAAGPPAAAGGEASLSREARARVEALTSEGKKLAGRERWADALDRFREAAAIQASPKLMVYMGVAEENLGRLLNAKALYEAALAGARAAKLRREERAAEGALAKLGPRIPRLKIRVPAGVEASVVVDDTPAPAGSREILIDPGRHRLLLKAPGRTAERREIIIAEGEELLIEGALRAEPPPAPPAPASRRPSREVVILGAVGGGLFLTGGAVFTGGAASHAAGAPLMMGAGGGVALVGIGAGIAALVTAYQPSPPRGQGPSSQQASNVSFLEAGPLPGGAWAGVHGAF